MQRDSRFSRNLVAIFVQCLLIGTAGASQTESIQDNIAQLQEKYGSGKSGGVYYRAEDDTIVLNMAANQPALFDLPPNTEVKSVKYTLADLQTWQQRVINEFMNQKVAARVGSGMAVGIDVENNQVEIKVRPDLPYDLMEKINTLASESGGRVRVVNLERRMVSFSNDSDSSAEKGNKNRRLGGDLIYKLTPEVGPGKTADCTLGLNVLRNKKEPSFLTAGHCGETGKVWYSDATREKIGSTVVDVLGPSDYSIVKYYPNQLGERFGAYVNLYNGSVRAIKRFGEAYVGQPVMKSAGATHLTKGKVKKLNITIVEQGITFHDLIETDTCGGPGDSGALLFDGETAVGLLHAGEDHPETCENTANSVTYFSPIKKLEAQYQLALPRSDIDTSDGGGTCQDCVRQ